LPFLREYNYPVYGRPLGSIVREIRRVKGIPLLLLAKRMGVSYSYLAKIEMGSIFPVDEQIEVIKAFIDGRL